MEDSGPGKGGKTSQGFPVWGRAGAVGPAALGPFWPEARGQVSVHFKGTSQIQPLASHRSEESRNTFGLGMEWRQGFPFSHSVVSDSLQPHGHMTPCPSPTPRVYSNSYPLSWWCHPTISSSIVPFTSCLQCFPASGSFQMSQLFTSGGQSIGVSASASVLPMNIQNWFPLGWTDRISLQSKGLSRVFFNTTVQKHQFFSAQLSL